MSPSAWAPERDALSLLDQEAGPFGTDAYRRAVVATVPGWRDVSFGARARDGTLAALPLLGRRLMAESVPPWGYGGVVASRTLEPREAVAFLELASRRLWLRDLTVRWVDLSHASPFGRSLGSASVVPIDPDTAPASRYSRLARRSLKKAIDAGATVSVTTSGDEFWAVYARSVASRAPSASGPSVPYPEALVRRLIDDRSALVHAVRVEERATSVLLTLVARSHWMCWLAGQTEEGRSISASYLAYDALLGDARACGIRAVNLGASFGNGAEFKSHLGATEAPMREWRRQSFSGAAISGSLRVLARVARPKVR